MSRHGYVDDFGLDDILAIGRYRGRVASAIRGKRGQAFLRELRDALDAMPNKRLTCQDIVDDEGECCALGAVALARGMDVSNLDPEETKYVAEKFGIAECLVREITYENDEYWRYGNGPETDEQRWQYMRNWVDRQIITPTNGADQ